MSTDGNGSLVVSVMNNIPEGDEVILKAEPDSGFVLSSITVREDGGSLKKVPLEQVGENRFSFRMPAFNVNVRAEFIRNLYSVFIEPAENGKVTASETADIPVGKEVTLTIEPDEGYELDDFALTEGYADHPYTDMGSGVYTFIMPGGDVKVFARFKKIPPASYNISYDLNGGTLDGITFTAAEGDIIKLPAAPTREGYKFTQWKGSSYQPGDPYTVVGDHTFTAQWEKNAPEDNKVPETNEDKTNEDKINKDKNTDTNKDSKKDDTDKIVRASVAETKTVKTGDNAGIYVWIILAALSMSGAVGAIISKRKR